jgi:hypothetical protein
MRLTGQKNQCPGCDQYFNSNIAFEKHRVGEFGRNRRCRTPEEMIAKGMRLNGAGFWVSKQMLNAKSLFKGEANERKEN